MQNNKIPYSYYCQASLEVLTLLRGKPDYRYLTGFLMPFGVRHLLLQLLGELTYRAVKAKHLGREVCAGDTTQDMPLAFPAGHLICPVLEAFPPSAGSFLLLFR